MAQAKQRPESGKGIDTQRRSHSSEDKIHSLEDLSGSKRHKWKITLPHHRKCTEVKWCLICQLRLSQCEGLDHNMFVWILQCSAKIDVLVDCEEHQHHGHWNIMCLSENSASTVKKLVCSVLDECGGIVMLKFVCTQ